VASSWEECSDAAARLQSVNTVTIGADGVLHGDSTDGAGFVRSLLEAGHDPAGASALVLGAGGAARAVVLALARHGATVTVSARRNGAAATAAELADGAFAPWDERDDAAGAADLVVNATPI